MITKAQVKHIQSLEDKKNRTLYGEFVVEGDKMVTELIQSGLTVKYVYAVKEWIDAKQFTNSAIETVIVEDFELSRISSLKTPNKVLAVAQIPVYKNNDHTLALLLDGIQDPGNLGSIIRIADWYQIPAIYCSESCADAFNAKVIQASMGSVFRIPVIKCNLVEFVQSHTNTATYASVLQGKDVNTFDTIKEGFIIIGNESNGISEELQKLSRHKITICRKGHAESLNAAVATGIICHCMLS